MKILLIIITFLVTPVCAIIWVLVLIALMLKLSTTPSGYTGGFFNSYTFIFLAWLAITLTFFIYQTIQILKGRISSFLKITIAALITSILGGYYLFAAIWNRINPTLGARFQFVLVGFLILIIVSVIWLYKNPEKRSKS